MALIAYNLVVFLAHGSLFVNREFQLSDLKAHIADEVNFVGVFAEHVSIINDAHL